MACAFFFLSPSPLLDSSPVIFIKIHSSLSLVARENHYFIDYRSISVNRSLPSIIDAHFMSQFVMFFFRGAAATEKITKIAIEKEGWPRSNSWLNFNYLSCYPRHHENYCFHFLMDRSLSLSHSLVIVLALNLIRALSLTKR